VGKRKPSKKLEELIEKLMDEVDNTVEEFMIKNDFPPVRTMFQVQPSIGGSEFVLMDENK
jgi:hypothetical protein